LGESQNLETKERAKQFIFIEFDVLYIFRLTFLDQVLTHRLGFPRSERTAREIMEIYLMSIGVVEGNIPTVIELLSSKIAFNILFLV
jgi:hypothetical protein